jgi:purine-nucleoside phosphorylase
VVSSARDAPLRAAEFLLSKTGGNVPRVAVVLGSGSRGLAETMDDAVRVPYSDIPGFPEPTVLGHGGELLFGVLEGVPVVVQSGRLHLYEGHAPATVVLPVRTLACLGIGTLIVTNAAGGVRSSLTPPTLMLIADHLNYMWRSPLLGPALDGEERFPDMSAAYDEDLRSLAREVAQENGVPLAEGVYAGVLGPNYETPAEVRMLASLGADAVGMSTVPEVIAARARGVRVLGISTITNLAAGISRVKLSHEEVLAAGERMSENLGILVRGVLKRLSNV